MTGLPSEGALRDEAETDSASRGLHDWVDGRVFDDRSFSADPAATMAALIEGQTRIIDEQTRAKRVRFIDDAWSPLADPSATPDPH